MTVVIATASIVLAGLLVYSAVSKLSHSKGVVEGYARAGVPEQWLNALATLLLSAAAGLVAGLFWAPLEIASAAALCCYFAVAIRFHLRAGDAAHLPTPLLMLALAAAVLILQVMD